MMSGIHTWKDITTVLFTIDIDIDIDLFTFHGSHQDYNNPYGCGNSHISLTNSLNIKKYYHFHYTNWITRHGIISNVVKN